LERFGIGDFSWRYHVSIHGRDQVILKDKVFYSEKILVLNKGLLRLKVLIRIRVFTSFVDKIRRKNTVSLGDKKWSEAF